MLGHHTCYGQQEVNKQKTIEDQQEQQSLEDLEDKGDIGVSVSICCYMYK